MELKLSNYRLDNYYGDVNVEPGIKVCSSNGVKNLGILTNIIKIDKNPWGSAISTVEVMWLTGKKKGQRETKEASNLVNYNKYRAAIDKRVDELNKLEAEAAKTGM